MQTCFLCGAENPCLVIRSTNTFGAPDLDLRPPEMQRLTMSHWLKECEKCGYVASNLADENPNAQSVIDSEAFHAFDEKTPELAKRFARFALLNSDDFRKSGNALLRAAWDCDDHDADDLAVQFRDQAADLLLSFGPHEDWPEELLNEAVRLVDVLRRARRFAEAINLIDELLSFESLQSNETIQ